MSRHSDFYDRNVFRASFITRRCRAALISIGQVFVECESQARHARLFKDSKRFELIDSPIASRDAEASAYRHADCISRLHIAYASRARTR